MLGVTAAIAEFFAAVGLSIVRTGATVGLAAMLGAGAGVAGVRAVRKRRAKKAK